MTAPEWVNIGELCALVSDKSHKPDEKIIVRRGRDSRKFGWAEVSEWLPDGGAKVVVGGKEIRISANEVFNPPWLKTMKMPLTTFIHPWHPPGPAQKPGRGRAKKANPDA